MQQTALDLDEYWRRAHEKGFSGAGVILGVVDTGADAQSYKSSTSLNEQASAYASVDVPWGSIEKLGNVADVHSEERRHGGQVFRRLLSGAPSSIFLDIGMQMPSTERGLLESVQLAVSMGADVINLSIGRLVLHQDAADHGQTCPICDYAGRLAADNDVLVLAAAGNYGNQGFVCPGLCPSVLSVGSGLTSEESAFYRENPGSQERDFLEGQSSTSYATAMVSTLYAVLRSAFPAVTAIDWFDFVQSNRETAGDAFVIHNTPEVVLSELRAICGGWSANSADWKLFATGGAKTRRELLARMRGSGIKGYAELREWLPEQRRSFRMFVDAQWAMVEGREKRGNIATLSQSIDSYRIGVSKFEKLGQTARLAVARTWLASALVDRGWKTVIGQLIVTDIVEAERELTRAYDALTVLRPRRCALEGSALSWRARARTLLAAVEPNLNEGALADGRNAVNLLSAEPVKTVKHDLALAHLHLARALYFRVWSARVRPVIAGAFNTC